MRLVGAVLFKERLMEMSAGWSESQDDPAFQSLHPFTQTQYLRACVRVCLLVLRRQAGAMKFTEDEKRFAEGVYAEATGLSLDCVHEIDLPSFDRVPAVLDAVAAVFAEKCTGTPTTCVHYLWTNGEGVRVLSVCFEFVHFHISLFPVWNGASWRACIRRSCERISQ